MSQRVKSAHWGAGLEHPSPEGAERLAEIFEIGAYRRAKRDGAPRPRPRREPALGVVTVEVPHVLLRGDRNYWLCRCQGFDVVEGGRRRGVVIGVRFGTRVDRPDVLEVRAGRLRQHLELVRVADVEELDVAGRTVRLAEQLSCAGSSA